MFSDELRAAIKLSRWRQYELAQRAGVHPTMLSAWLNGIYPVPEGDARVLKLARLLGVPPNRAFAENHVQRRSIETRVRR